MVQGVGFRHTTCVIAKGYEVTGFVRNLSDGRVEVVVEGSPGQLDLFLEELGERMSGHIRSDDPNIPNPNVQDDPQSAAGQFASFAIRY